VSAVPIVLEMMLMTTNKKITGPSNYPCSRKLSTGSPRRGVCCRGLHDRYARIRRKPGRLKIDAVHLPNCGDKQKRRLAV
jgi:hypothetical protein